MSVTTEVVHGGVYTAPSVSDTQVPPGRLWPAQGDLGAGWEAAEPSWTGSLCGEQPGHQLPRKQPVPNPRGLAYLDQRNGGEAVS